MTWPWASSPFCPPQRSPPLAVFVLMSPLLSTYGGDTRKPKVNHTFPQDRYLSEKLWVTNWKPGFKVWTST